MRLGVRMCWKLVISAALRRRAQARSKGWGWGGSGPGCGDRGGGRCGPVASEEEACVGGGGGIWFHAPQWGVAWISGRSALVVWASRLSAAVLGDKLF